ncbi:MAG: hypothetical protein JO053_02130 [Acidobacteria bacterium]|nr:hypothetical protein [Acidobacteriota bacterium]
MGSLFGFPIVFLGASVHVDAVVEGDGSDGLGGYDRTLDLLWLTARSRRIGGGSGSCHRLGNATGD